MGAVSNPKLPGNYVLHIATQDRSYRQWIASGLQRLPFVPRTKVQQVAESVVEADCASSRWVWVITGTEAVKMVAGNWDQTRVNAPAGALYAPYFKGLSAAENAQLASELFEIGSFVQ